MNVYPVSKMFVSRYPLTDSPSTQAGPQTYIVAQNPEVLAHLMRENENRVVCPSAYTTPASVFNTVAVDFDEPERCSESPVLKTCPIPVQSLQELDSESVGNVVDGGNGSQFSSPVQTLKNSSSYGTGSLGSGGQIPNSTSYSPPSLSGPPSYASSYIPSSISGPISGQPIPITSSLSGPPSYVSSYIPGPISSGPITSYTVPVSSFSSSPLPVAYVPVSSYVPASSLPLVEGIYDFGGADVKSCAHTRNHALVQNAATEVATQQTQVRACSLPVDVLRYAW